MELIDSEIDQIKVAVNSLEFLLRAEEAQLDKMRVTLVTEYQRENILRIKFRIQNIRSALDRKCIVSVGEATVGMLPEATKSFSGVKRRKAAYTKMADIFTVGARATKRMQDSGVQVLVRL